MARTTSANFTGALDFTLATAGPDLFVKDDVQILAQAVDQHDHTAGKGLALSASSIPAGLITSAMIANGAVSSVDLAANAVSQLRWATGTTANPTTTSSTLADIPEMVLTFTAGGTDAVASQVLILLNGTFSDSTLSAICSFGISIDAADVVIQPINAPIAGGGGMFIPTVMYLSTSLAAGAHTIKGRWSTNAGTLTCNQTQRQLVVVEFRR